MDCGEEVERKNFRMRALQMGERAEVDISRYSFGEFVSFLFDREVPPKTVKRSPWYWNMEVAFNSRQVCNYHIRLFLQPRFLIEKFSREQLEQGFWAIQGPTIDCSVWLLIWNTDVPFAARRECVRSMFNLFEELFASEPLETSVQMWWDSLCYEWQCGNKDR